MDAYERGLVDNLGDLNDAIAAAAELAELGDDWEITYIEKEVKFREKMLEELMAKTAGIAGADLAKESPLHETVRRIQRSAAEFAALNDPNHAYALSMIETD